MREKKSMNQMREKEKAGKEREGEKLPESQASPLF